MVTLQMFLAGQILTHGAHVALWKAHVLLKQSMLQAKTAASHVNYHLGFGNCQESCE